MWRCQHRPPSTLPRERERSRAPSADLRTRGEYCRLGPRSAKWLPGGFECLQQSSMLYRTTLQYIQKRVVYIILKQVRRMQENTSEPNEKQQDLDETTDAASPTLEDLQKAYDDLNSRYLRLAADFDNYRKRMAREIEARQPCHRRLCCGVARGRG